VSEIIPDDLRDFVLRHFDSIAQLEALLLLRANPREEWDVARTTARLYTTPREVTAALTRLCEDGFLACANGIYRYQCRDPELQQQVDRLAATYAKHLIPVTNLIHSKLRRIKQFADAFKFRKDR